MNEAQAEETVAAVEQVWQGNIAEGARAMWQQAMLPYNSATVAVAILRLSERQRERPTIAQLRQAIEELEVETAPEFRSKPVPAVVDEAALKVAPWVKGWAVARYRHRAMGALREQKPGYDSLQRHNPLYRTYVWPEQKMLADEDQERYMAEGASLTTAEVFSLLGNVLEGR